MKFDLVKVVHVYYKPRDNKIFVGRLALNNRKLFFEYDASFIETGSIELDKILKTSKKTVIARSIATKQSHTRLQ